MKKRTLTAVIATSALVAGSILAGASSAQADTNTLVVNAGAVLRPVTHVAAGGLYALATTTTPDPTQLPPLHLNQLTQPAPGVQQIGNGATVITGDALKVAPTAINAGAQTTIRMADIYPGFPYQGVTVPDYLSKIDTMVKARLSATQTTNINGWELWNEPNGTWDTNANGPFNDAWVKMYREVRSLDTVTPIVGPSYSGYDHDAMLAFLQNDIANNTVPDVISWHELNGGAGGWQEITSDVSDLKAIESQLGITPRPVSINEYGAPDQIDVPSAALHYVAQFERAGVRDAERAYWFESGTANGLLYNNQPTASYWMYKWYGDMTGNMLPVTASNYLDGIASQDTTRKIVNVVFGGQANTTSVQVNGLSGYGTQVKATLNFTPGSGRQTNVAAPTSLGTQTLNVVNGSVTVPVSTTSDYQGAYQLLITPVTGPTTTYQQTYEAENATVVNAQRLSSSSASNGSYVGRIDGSADQRSDSFVDFLVNVPTAGTYKMAIRYANGGTATSTQGLAYDGGAFSTISYPVTGSWGTFSAANTVSTTLNLTAGSNVIRLAKGAPNFSGGSGYAELDSINLTAQ